jgi:drug/metabolite transporter (DMT)-like permease
VLAVIGLVAGFSMSSTLAKQAESPGVLIAFWRMIVVSIVWSLLLAATARRVRMADVRQVFIPGIFFGLNLAVFFTGVTHNSVANAALIGSLAPFLIVPLGAWLFRERFRSRALVFAAIAFCGVAVVLFNAPPIGDASLEGNLLGLLAMFVLVGYVVSTRHFRRDMDVTTFMATICPIAAVAVLPVALAHGDVTGLSGTGWKYMLILTFTSGVMAQGLLVYRDGGGRTRRVRRHASAQRAGTRGSRAARACYRARDRSRGGVMRSTRSRSVMKCEASDMRASARSCNAAAC